ncbi:MAG: ABC transporter permease subunit [Actinobacteria bacterium]|nr:ABC transporter permease subunit [Actinomycetota bacterium]
MEVFWKAIAEGTRLLAHGDPYTYGIIALSLRVSGISLLIASAIGIPAGYLIGSRRFRGRSLVTAVVNTGMGLPPVVVGLVVYMLVSRSGPLSQAWTSWLGGIMPRILYTVPAMILAQVIISLPLVVGVTLAAVGSVPMDLRLQARSLGASGWHEAALTIKEARRGVMAAVAAGFGGIISEVGAVSMVGGNIEGSTRVMTTAIVLETNKGNFGKALALGFILIGIAFLIMNGMTWLQQSGGRYER